MKKRDSILYPRNTTTKRKSGKWGKEGDPVRNGELN